MITEEQLRVWEELATDLRAERFEYSHMEHEASSAITALVAEVRELKANMMECAHGMAFEQECAECAEEAEIISVLKSGLLGFRSLRRKA